LTLHVQRPSAAELKLRMVSMRRWYQKLIARAPPFSLGVVYPGRQRAAMLSKALHELQSDPAKWERCRGFFKVLKIPAKTSLLREGEVAHSMYFVKEGCLRLWFNKDGKDVTFQFFLEDQAVASMESFLGGSPSLFSLESIEPTTAAVIGRQDWDRINEAYPNLRDFFMQIVLQRMESYGRLFLSRIKDSPRERYEELLREHPEIVRRIPQHYIASHLGVTPVSLSRIRNRIHKKAGAAIS